MHGGTTSVEDQQSRDTAWLADAVSRMRIIDPKRIGNDKLGAFSLQDGTRDDLFSLREIDELVRVAFTAIVVELLTAMRDMPEVTIVTLDLAGRRVLFRSADGFVTRTMGEMQLLSSVDRRTRLTHNQSVVLFRAFIIALCDQPPARWGGLVFEKREIGVSASRPETG